jgi:hypothetical protein
MEMSTPFFRLYWVERYCDGLADHGGQGRVLSTMTNSVPHWHMNLLSLIIYMHTTCLRICAHFQLLFCPNSIRHRRSQLCQCCWSIRLSDANVW